MLLHKHPQEIIIDPELSAIFIKLSQEDTFALRTGEVELRFRMKVTDGTVFGSENPVYFEVDDIDDEDEVI